MVDETYMVDNYKVTIEHDFEEDNVKAFTDVITPDGNRHFLDVTPYSPSKDLITRMIEFHQKFGYFVTRAETGSGGCVELHELNALFEEAEEHQFDNVDGKIYD
jgi:hypothetical protein